MGSELQTFNKISTKLSLGKECISTVNVFSHFFNLINYLLKQRSCWTIIKDNSDKELIHLT